MHPCGKYSKRLWGLSPTAFFFKPGLSVSNFEIIIFISNIQHVVQRKNVMEGGKDDFQY